MRETTLVFCVSSKPQILQLRGRVLATRYNVVSVETLEQIEALPQSSASDLLVLCDTLREDECGRAIKLAEQKLPGIKVLIITAPFSDCGESAADTSVNSLAHPSAMFAGITKLLEQHPHPDTGYGTASR